MMGKEAIKMSKWREKLKWEKGSFISFPQKNASVIMKKKRRPATGAEDEGSGMREADQMKP